MQKKVMIGAGHVKVLMFGWEFPPYNCGGLGTACFGLTRALAKQGVEITFVVPYAEGPLHSDHVKLISASEGVKIKRVSSLLRGYATTTSYADEYKRTERKKTSHLYGRDLFAEVDRYSKVAGEIAQTEDFDVIHCHDWMTFGAGLHAKTVSGKPLILHIHATEFDRTGGNGVNQYVYDVEKYGMQHADAVIAISNYVKNTLIKQYGIEPHKIKVVHNGSEWEFKGTSGPRFRIAGSDKVVLFLGRVTLQKGPEYFIAAAKKVLEKDPNVKFIIAGSGDMEQAMIEKSAELGIADKVLFTGFLRGPAIDRAYQMADVFVMPSVSEPFGLVPLESLKNGTPVIISKQSGVSEVLHGALKVDFWDTEQMANMVLATLHYPALHQCLTADGMEQASKLTWDTPAEKCVSVYQNVCTV